MNQWVERSVPLTLDLGDKRIWSIPLRLFVRQVRLGIPANDIDPSLPPTDPLSPTVSGFLIRSMPLEKYLPRLSRAQGFVRYVRLQYERCFVDLSIGFDRYQAKFSAKTRSTIKRKLRKVSDENGGQIIWRRYAEPETLNEFFEHAGRISGRSYQHRLFDAGLPVDDEFRAQATELARQDKLRAYLLFHQGEPAAYLYCPVQDNALIYAYLGYDPRFMALSVGTVLQWVALQDIYAENRFSWFDFTAGEGEHKRLFATGQIRSGDVYYLRPKPAVVLTLLIQMAVDRVSHWAGLALDRMGLKARIKQILRFGHGQT